MCIIIDTNTLTSVFIESDANHADFKPVFDWIYHGKGKIVYGGTKYIEEIPHKFIRLFNELRRAKKAVLVQAELVDAETIIVDASISHPNFDDQHLVGLLKVSGCKLICSLDQRAYPYFRHSIFFSPARTKPKIYSSAKNLGLLSDRNIASVCLPCAATTNQQRALIPRLSVD